jgi:hypothetical protein
VSGDQLDELGLDSDGLGDSDGVGVPQTGKLLRSSLPPSMSSDAEVSVSPLASTTV